jgi:hypothetical protein
LIKSLREKNFENKIQRKIIGIMEEKLSLLYE